MLINLFITCVAVLVAPIIAVRIGQRLQDRSKVREEKRNDKMEIFKVLMSRRMNPETEANVYAMNLIDVVFSDSDKVRVAWKDFFESVKKTKESYDAKEAMKKRWKLLETISDDLGYKDKVTWETVQDPYLPENLGLMWIAEEQFRTMQYKYMTSALHQMMNSGTTNITNTDGQPHNKE